MVRAVAGARAGSERACRGPAHYGLRGVVLRWLKSALLFGAVALCTGPVMASPVTPKDIVEMRDLAEPDIKNARWVKPSFSISPDGSRVAFVTRKASVGSGRNLYELLSYDSSEVRKFVTSSSPRKLLPSPHVLVRF